MWLKKILVVYKYTQRVNASETSGWTLIFRSTLISSNEQLQFIKYILGVYSSMCAG